MEVAQRAAVNGGEQGCMEQEGDGERKSLSVAWTEHLLDLSALSGPGDEKDDLRIIHFTPPSLSPDPSLCF